jgi:hypothetical protein
LKPVIAVKKQLLEHGARISLNPAVILDSRWLQLLVILQVIASRDAVLILKKDYAWKILLKEYVKNLKEHGIKANYAKFLNAI